MKDLDLLTSHACPLCGKSLRFRLLSPAPAPGNALRMHDAPWLCPHCGGKVVEQRHPALASDHLWLRYTLPGMVLFGLGIFLPAFAWLFPLAMVATGLGLAATLAYMVHERLQSPRYLPYEEPPDCDEAQGP